jgi:hypothetical protein
MLEIAGWTLFITLGLFMFVGATMLIVDTVVQWRRETKIQKQWQQNTF